MSQEYAPAADPTRRVRLLLLTIWAGMTAAGLGFVLAFGHDQPWADEWEFVPALTGHEPAGPWLWAQHNEHRLPLPRLVYLALFRLTGDFRAGMVCQIVLLSALALGLMRSVARVRGRPAWADLFIPVGLLHWGHAENFLMGYQVCFALICVLVCGMIVAAWHRAGGCVGVLLLGLEGCGASGLPFVPPVVGWLVWLAFRRRAATVAVLGMAAAVFVPVYFAGYERPPHHPPARVENAGLAAAIAAEYLGMGFGFGAVPVWPAAAAGVIGLAAATTWRLVRLRKWGVVGVLAGAVGLAAAVGVGRSGFGHWDMGLWSRYGLLAWPVLFAGYLAFTNADGRFGTWVQPGLCVVSVALLPFNTAAGLAWAGRLDRGLSALEADAHAGMPAAELVAKHLAGSGQEERALRGLPMLREVRNP